MPITNAFEPARHAFPPDFLAWVATLTRFKRLRADLRGAMWCFTFDSLGQMDGHAAGMTHQAASSLLAVDVLESVNWRCLVAAHLRAVRFACRRRTNPASALDMKAPRMPGRK